MADISDPKEYDRVNANFLRTQLTKASTQMQALNEELVARAMPRVGEVIDGLQRVLAISQAGNPQAKELLRRFIATLDAVRDESRSLTVVRNGKQDG